MFKLQQRKISSKFLIILSVLLMATGYGLIFFNFNKQTTALALTDDTVLNVYKVNMEVASDAIPDPSVEYGYNATLLNDLGKLTENTSDINNSVLDRFNSTYEVTENDFVMLNNSTLEETSEGSGIYNVEALYLEFAVEGDGVYWLPTVTLYVNGIAANIEDKGHKAGDINNYENYTYAQILDLHRLKKQDGSQFTEAELEGHYEYVFAYSDATYNYEKSFSFYLANESSYVNDGSGTDTTEPIIYNTNKLSRADISFIQDGSRVPGTKEVNYFNYTNVDTTDYFGNPIVGNTDVIFPALTYDATKYSMQYTKIVDSEAFTYTTLLDVTSYDANKQPEEGILYIFENEVGINAYNFTGGDFYVDFIFEDIAKYSFSFDYLLLIPEFPEDAPNITSTTNPELVVMDTEALVNEMKTPLAVVGGSGETVDTSRIEDVELYVFGYQLYYSGGQDGNGENLDIEFRNLDLANPTPITDYSYKLDATTNPTNIPDIFNSITDSVASTNQAPVFLKNYGSLSYNEDTWVSDSYYNRYSDKTKTTILENTIAYTNNTRFKENGYYEVVVNYTFSEHETSKDTVWTQIFAFEISNTPPEVTIEDSEGEIIVNGGFTKNSVTISWTDETQEFFNIVPTGSYVVKEFETSNILASGSLTNGVTQLSTAGNYTVVIKYGQSSSTQIVYRFTIDATEISGVKIEGVSETDGGSYSLNGETYSQTVVNAPFTVTWNEKASGAATYATYSFTEIFEDEAVTKEFVLTDSVTNGYASRSNTFTDIAYSKYTLNEDDIMEDATCTFSDTGIYMFTVMDEAGHIFKKLVVYDNSKAHIIQTPASNSSDNTVTEDVMLEWGSSKAIILNSATLDLDTTPYDEVESNNFPTLFDTVNNYLLINITSSKLNYSNTVAELSVSPNVLDLSSKNGVIIYDGVDADENGLDDTYEAELAGGTLAYPENYTELYVNFAANKQEKYFRLLVNDEANLTDGSELEYLSSLFVEMNLDKSQVKAITYTNTDGSDSSNSRRLYEGLASNRQKLFLTFKNPDEALDDYKIDILEYDYYPFSYNTADINYPFSDTATNVNVSLLDDISSYDGDTTYLTAPINAEHSTEYSAEVTLTGKYVVTRTYISNGQFDTPEEYTKDYVFYIDRNGIIVDDATSLELNEYLVGKEITVTMGVDDTTFDTFLISTGTKDTLFETNKLPVVLNIPKDKYYEITGADTFKQSDLYSFGLKATVVGTYKGRNIVNETFSLDEDADNFLDIMEFTEPGEYVVTLEDKTGYMGSSTSTDLIKSNIFTFEFEIKTETPTGQFYGDPFTISGDDTVYYTPILATSTNDNTLIFTWEDPVDIYTAKIDPNKIKLYKTVGSGSPSLITSNVYNFADNPEEEWTYTKDGNKYSLTIFDSAEGVRPELDIEAKYSVYVEYEGDANDYNNSFNSNLLSVYIDRTAPEYNLNYLLGLDNFLEAAEKTAIQNDNVFMPTEDINLHNYAISIPKTTVFVQDSIRDSNNIYYRQVNNYSKDSLVNISILPDSPYYNDHDTYPANPSFDATSSDYTKFTYGSSEFQEASFGYYEIIEVDEAGNYISYVIRINEQPQTISYTYEGAIADEIATNVITSIDKLNVEFTALNVDDDWIKIIIKNNMTNSTISYSTANKTKAELLDALNSFIEYKDSYATTGSSFDITIINRSDFNNNTNATNDSISFTYNSPGELIVPTVNIYSDRFSIVVPESNGSSTVETFEVFEIVTSTEGGETTESLSPLYSDLNGKLISGSGSYELFLGAYYLKLTDNFDRVKYYKIFDQPDEKSVNYTGENVTIDNIVYTASDVEVVYQTKLYRLNVEKYTLDDGDNWVLSTDPIGDVIVNTETYVGTLTLSLPVDENGNIILDNKVKYVVSIISDAPEDVSEYSYYAEYTFILDTNVIDINLMNAEGNNLSVTQGEYIGTTQDVYIVWDAYDQTFQNIIVNVSKTNESGFVTEFNDIQSGKRFSGIGTYTVIATNDLGVSVSKTFLIQETETIMFDIVESYNDQVIRTLPKADGYYLYSGENLVQYYTTATYSELDSEADSQYFISLNPDKGLSSGYVTTTDENTLVFTIYSDSYTGGVYTMFAVTTIQASINFVTVTPNQQEFNSSTDVTVTWSDSRGQTEETVNNTVYVDYYYNDVFVDKIYSSKEVAAVNSITLTDAGVYKLYFKDLAGNTQQFGFANYMEITILNDVIFYVNNLSPINYVIFNEDVDLEISSLSNYDYEDRVTTLRVNITKNGKSYISDSMATSFNFSDIGIYTVSLTAKKNGSELNTPYTFTILSSTQSRQVFEYNCIAGYKVSSVVKNNRNITYMFTNSELTNFNISTNDEGAGSYTITVDVSYTSLKPGTSFSFDVQLNDRTPSILCSIDEGTSTTDAIIITYNRGSIYQDIGECYIVINGKRVITINEASANATTTNSFPLTEAADYVVQLVTADNNTVLSFKVTKEDPLNATAIIIIVVGAFVIGGLIFIFFRLRRNMRIR